MYNRISSSLWQTSRLHPHYMNISRSPRMSLALWVLLMFNQNHRKMGLHFQHLEVQNHRLAIWVYQTYWRIKDYVKCHLLRSFGCQAQEYHEHSAQFVLRHLLILHVLSCITEFTLVRNRLSVPCAKRSSGKKSISRHTCWPINDKWTFNSRLVAWSYRLV